MSGIVGYWAYMSPDAEASAFTEFTRSLAHRGPDDSGIKHFPETRLWLGHRRLVTSDVSAQTRQPARYADGRYWLVCDGEVYNYVELRNELSEYGHRCHLASEIEVILAAYAQWGANCQLRFNGKWAFAIWDSREHKLFLSRDRFGIKPLFFGLHNGAFVFASELKGFLVLPWINGAFDPAVLREVIGDVDAGEGLSSTLLPGVQRLPAGHSLLVDAEGNVQTSPWWNTLAHLPRPATRLEEQTEEFRALLSDACRIRSRGGEELAIEQSGGLDSSAISCTLADLDRHNNVDANGKHRRRAFIARVRGTPYDESDQARVVVERTGMLPHFVDVEDQHVVDDIEKIIFDHEVIFWFPRVGSWMLYRSMRDAGIRVSLNGMDPDTLFFSDREDIELALDEAAARGDSVRYWELRRILDGQEEIERGTVSALGELRWAARRQLARCHLLRPFRVARAAFRTFRHGVANDHPAQMLVEARNRRKKRIDALDPPRKGMSDVASKYFFDFHTGLQTFLANFDRAALAHGVELRMPFMDWRIVTYCFALPDASRNGGGYTKRLLRLATKGLLPEPVRLRTVKTAFVSPLDVWVRGPLKPWILDLCASRSFLESTVWNGAAVRNAVERAVAGDASVVPAWPIIQAYVLERAFVARAHQAAAE